MIRNASGVHTLRPRCFIIWGSTLNSGRGTALTRFMPSNFTSERCSKDRLVQNIHTVLDPLPPSSLTSSSSFLLLPPPSSSSFLLLPLSSSFFLLLLPLPLSLLDGSAILGSVAAEMWTLQWNQNPSTNQKSKKPPQVRVEVVGLRALYVGVECCLCCCYSCVCTLAIQYKFTFCLLALSCWGKLLASGSVTSTGGDTGSTSMPLLMSISSQLLSQSEYSCPIPIHPYVIITITLIPILPVSFPYH